MRLWHFLFIFTSLGVLSISAHAAETGMYRPGQAYQSVSVANPNICAAHCRGDAQCRGWNFVRVRPDTSSGVCELNARRVAPVASAISISGDAVNANPSTQLVSSGMRTVRVGALPTPSQNRVVRVGQVPQPTPQTQPTQRRVVKHTPPPTLQKTMPAAYRAPQPSPVPQAAPMPKAAPIPAPAPRPRFQHNLDSAPPAPQLASRGTPPTPKSFQAQKLKALIAAQNEQAQSQSKQAQSASSRVVPPRPPMMNPNDPTELVQQSLFGSLYDDVKAPKVLGPDDIPTDANAPIATVSSVPTKPVKTQNMMAGPPPPN